MFKRMSGRIFFLALAGILLAAAAQAATVSITPGMSTVMPSDAIMLSIKGSGFASKADSGDFTLTWDATVLKFTGVALAVPPWDTNFMDSTDVATGKLNSVFLGTSAFGGTGPDFDIAKVSFDVIGAPGTSTTVMIDDALIGWVAPGATVIPVTYANADVSVVPVPGAVWLLASGVASLVLRRKQTS